VSSCYVSRLNYWLAARRSVRAKRSKRRAAGRGGRCQGLEGKQLHAMPEDSGGYRRRGGRVFGADCVSHDVPLLRFRGELQGFGCLAFELNSHITDVT
jgi:hypothetical protein